MSTTSYAVSAKARAKYGSFLTEHDYDSILACQSVAEVMVYLKSNTRYSSMLADVSERDIHRGRLETLLRQYQFSEFDSLCRYDSGVSEGFSRFVVEKLEVEQIVHYLILFNSGSTEDFIFRFPAFLSKRTELDFNRLANARDYDALLDALSHTSYYDVLREFKPDGKGRLPVAQIENKLYAHIVSHIVSYIEKKTKGSERQELTDIFKKLIDYSIVSRILRLKRYYHISPEALKAGVRSEYSGLSPKLIDRMCAAEDAAEVMRVLQSTHYGRLIERAGADYEGDIGPRMQYTIAKKNLHFSNNPSVVMVSFMFLSETELMNVICLIEGIRYQVDPKTIRSMLIR